MYTFAFEFVAVCLICLKFKKKSLSVPSILLKTFWTEQDCKYHFIAIMFLSISCGYQMVYD